MLIRRGVLAGEQLNQVRSRFLRCLGMGFAYLYFRAHLGEFLNRGHSLRREDKVMDEPSLEDKLKELVREVSGQAEPQYKKPAMSAKQVHDSHKQLQESINNLRESLDYLRVCIKYQLFDLEATRRENEYLRKMLGEKDG